MPGLIFAEFILQPIFEAVVQVFGYWTGRVIVPVLSLGLIRFENVGNVRRARPYWHGFHRAKDGGIVIDEDMTMLLGLLFWAAAVAGGYLIYRYGSL
jgi:hypothetical protein